MKGEFIHTLRTKDLNTARKLRDKYLIPILAETKAIEMMEGILKILSNSDEVIQNKLIELGEVLGDDVEELTISQAFDKFIELRSPLSIRKLQLILI